MSSNIIGSLPKESDNPSEKVIKTSGYLDYTKKALVFTTDTVSKEGNTDIIEKSRKTWFGEGSHHSSYFRRKNDTVKKTEKS